MTKTTSTKHRAFPPSDPEAFHLTSPTRVVYPDRGTTKQQVADYYQSMMDWLLPEIIDRPLSIIRCTKGADGPCFFQKHHTPGLEEVGAVALKEQDGMEADYLVVRDGREVMELVQFNALEFHPWGSHAKTPDRADLIVFDLDPGPGVPWKDVIGAARKIRSLLEYYKMPLLTRTDTVETLIFVNYHGILYLREQGYGDHVSESVIKELHLSLPEYFSSLDVIMVIMNLQSPMKEFQT